MKIVRVTYTAKESFVAQNQQNIKQVMNDLQELNHPGIFYFTCLGADGKSFSHNAFFKDAEYEQILFDLDSFKAFQQQLKTSLPEIAPVQELLTLVGSSTPIFNA